MEELSLQLEQLMRRAGLQVDTKLLPDLLTYLSELQRWNRTHNLTAIRDLETALETHLVDSLTLLPHLPQGCRLLDFGSGGGLPGLPLRIVRAAIELTSLDAVSKKLSFQRHLARTLSLDRITFKHQRLEDFSATPGNAAAFDRVVFRAVGEIERFAPLVLPLLVPRGVLIAMKGPEGAGDWEPFLASPPLGYRCLNRVSLQLPRSGARRNLLFFEKLNNLR